MSDSTIALVVEGGAFRSVFSAGVLDGFLMRDFNPFDFHIGVSAGATNLAFYRAGDTGKSYRIFQELIENTDFISYRRFITGGHLLDLDWLYNSYFNETMLDIEKAFGIRQPLYICMTDVETGSPHYSLATAENYLDLFRATTALPLIYRHFPRINGKEMADGGVADSIPVAKAIEFGATRVIVIRARHYSYMKKDTFAHKLIRYKSRHKPALVDIMRQRIRLHRDTINLIRNPPDGVKIIEVCPPESFDIGRFSRNVKSMEQGYLSGLEQAEIAIKQFQSFA